MYFVHCPPPLTHIFDQPLSTEGLEFPFSNADDSRHLIVEFYRLLKTHLWGRFLTQRRAVNRGGWSRNSDSNPLDLSCQPCEINNLFHWVNPVQKNQKSSCNRHTSSYISIENGGVVAVLRNCPVKWRQDRGSTSPDECRWAEHTLRLGVTPILGTLRPKIGPWR